MKCLIVNAESFSHVDKKTGELVKAIAFDVVGRNLSKSSGKCVLEGIYVGTKYQSSLYNILITACNGDVSNFNNTFVNIEFDNKKNIVDFESIKTDKPVVTWGF